MFNYFINVGFTMNMIEVACLIDINAIKFAYGTKKIQGESHFILYIVGYLITFVCILVASNKVVYDSDDES